MLRLVVLVLVALCPLPVLAREASPILGLWKWNQSEVGPHGVRATSYYMRFRVGGKVDVTSVGGREGLEDEARFRLRGRQLHLRRKLESTLGWPEPDTPFDEVPSSYDCTVSFSADEQVMSLSGCGIAGEWARRPDTNQKGQ